MDTGADQVQIFCLTHWPNQWLTGSGDVKKMMVVALKPFES